jgi:hypothetical protein
MIEPSDRVFDCLNRGFIGRRWTAQHDNVDAERARRGDLAVGRATAAVLGNHHVDAMLGHQRMIVGFAERAAARNIADVRQWQWRIDWIDAADQIIVPRRIAQRLKLVAAERDKDAARRLTKRPNRLTDIAHLDPPVTRNLNPWRSSQRDQLHAAAPRGRDGVRRNHVGVRMGGVDQGIDALADEIFCETVGAAKATDTDRHRLRGGRCRAAGERQGDFEIVTPDEASGQLPRFRGAAENEDACHAGF